MIQDSIIEKKINLLQYMTLKFCRDKWVVCVKETFNFFLFLYEKS